MSRSSRLSWIVVVCCVCPLWASASRPNARAPGRSSYILRTSVVGAAGNRTAGGDYSQRGTLGQPSPVGVSTTTNGIHSAGFWSAWAGTVWTGIGDGAPIFTNALYQNYPNPFNPTTTIRFSVAQTGGVYIDIFDVQGRRVKALLRESRPPGTYDITWDGSDDRGSRVASGVYFCRMSAPGYQATKKITILK